MMSRFLVYFFINSCVYSDFYLYFCTVIISIKENRERQR